MFVKTADCVPVLIVEKNSRMVAAVHAGWRGVQQEITVKTCVRMKEETGQDYDQLPSWRELKKQDTRKNDTTKERLLEKQQGLQKQLAEVTKQLNNL